MQKFVARYYTPSVVGGAFLLATVPVILYKIPALSSMFTHQETFSEWIYRSLIFLVIACPCALVISIPLGFFGGIGAASKQGILVKGSNYLEGLNNMHTVVWDKTGTLTKGVFKVSEIVPVNGFSKEDVIEAAAKAERYSNHPIAHSILEYFNRKIDETSIKEYEEISGYGVKTKIENYYVMVGNDKLLHKENIEHPVCKIEGTVVHVVINKKYAGYIVISDEIKEDAKQTIQTLKNMGVKRQIMLTGDSEEVAKTISKKLGIEEYFAELLPHQKVEKIEKLIKNKENKNELVVFVGDGVNDAPVIVRSDIGIAMGALGSDAAIEAADIVLMSDEPSKIPAGVKIARKTRYIVWQNIIFALGVKFLFLGMGVTGKATMWEAVFADVGVALFAILNSMRILTPFSNRVG